jgi:transcriptional regulator with XRE-family HTH domain
MPQRKLTQFPDVLKRHRIAAGYQSLSQVVLAAERLTKGPKGPKVALSKTKLNQYENGLVDTLKPDTLRLLAKLYNIPFQRLATAWFSERYGIDESRSGELSLSLPEAGTLELTGGNQSISIIGLDCFKRKQSELAKGSYVIIATRRFLDDTPVFFEMVARNISRGVRYLYLCPESHRDLYRNLVSKLESYFATRGKQIDTKQTFFFSRHDFESPINQVVYVEPMGRLTGYIGLTDDELPLAYQITTERLAMRMFTSLLSAIRASHDSDFIKELRRHEADVSEYLKANQSTEIIRETLKAAGLTQPQ